MSNAAKRRGERALTEVVGILDQARGALAHRLDELDLHAIEERGVRWAGAARSNLQRRPPPRRSRVSGWTVAGVSGIVALGAIVAGIGYVVYDRERRDAARQRLGGVQNRARQRYAELMGGRTQAEADLEGRVRQAVAAGGTPPQGLDVVVEGRTVYLRGSVSDPAFVDAAAERVHGVSGVVAVVNLTTSAADEKRTTGANR